MDRDLNFYRTLRIERKRLHEQIADSLEEMILSNQVQPGTRLPTERVLAEHLGVTRTTVHQALSLLEQRGLVELKVGSGTYVINVPESAVTNSLKRYLTFGNYPAEDLDVFRWALEPEVAALAAESATAEDVKALQQVVARFNTAGTQGDLDAQVANDVAFHATLALATHNSIVIAIMKALHHYIETTMRQEPTPWPEAYAAHRAIYEAIAARDAEGARQAMRAHFLPVKTKRLAGRIPSIPHDKERR